MVTSFKNMVRNLFQKNPTGPNTTTKNNHSDTTGISPLSNDSMFLSSQTYSSFVESLSSDPSSRMNSEPTSSHQTVRLNHQPSPPTPLTPPELPILVQPVHFNTKPSRLRKYRFRSASQSNPTYQAPNNYSLKVLFQSLSSPKPDPSIDTNRFESLLKHFTILCPLLHADKSCMTYSVLKHSTLQVNTARIFKKISSYETNAEYRRRLQREITLTSQLEHNNILRLNDVFLHDQLHFVVTDGGFFSGTGLLTQTIPFETGISLFWDLLEGLKYLHNLNVAHLDLSLENLAIFYEGTLKICNFGKSLVAHDHQPTSLAPGFDPHNAYTSPELLIDRTRITHLTACDIWSAGVLGFHFLSCRLPWKCASPHDPAYQWYVSSPSPIYLPNPPAVPYAPLLTAMLATSPPSRITAPVALQHLRSLFLGHNPPTTRPRPDTLA